MWCGLGSVRPSLLSGRTTNKMPVHAVRIDDRDHAHSRALGHECVCIRCPQGSATVKKKTLNCDRRITS